MSASLYRKVIDQLPLFDVASLREEKTDREFSAGSAETRHAGVRRAENFREYFLKASGQPKPFQNNNQWAADFGGPIKKGKAYFFVDTEGLPYIFATATQSFLPTPAFQSYALSQIPATATSFYQQAFKLYNGAKGAANAVPTANTCPGIVGTTVNALPSGSTDCLGAVTLAGSSGNQEWLLIGRVDYSFGENDKLFGRVKFDRGTQPTYADPINPAFNAISHQPQDEGQLNYTHIFSPTVTENTSQPVHADIYITLMHRSSRPSQFRKSVRISNRDLPNLPALMQNALGNPATGVKSECSPS